MMSPGSWTSLKVKLSLRALQVEGLNYGQTYASVACFTTLQALLAIATQEDWELHQVDIWGAYLQG
jgi:hypothetical protein